MLAKDFAERLERCAERSLPNHCYYRIALRLSGPGTGAEAGEGGIFGNSRSQAQDRKLKTPEP